MTKRMNPVRYEVAADDPLVAEHAAVSAWIEEATASLGPQNYYKDVELKSLPSGRVLLDSKPEQAKQFLLAVVSQLSYWDRQTMELRSQGEAIRSHLDSLPQWQDPWTRQRQAQAAFNALIRRALPFDKQDLITILQRCNENDGLASYWMPIGLVSRAIERYAAEKIIDHELRDAIRCFAARRSVSRDKDSKRYATAMEQLCIDRSTETPHIEAEPDILTRPAPKPAPAGTPGVLVSLKVSLGMIRDEPERSTSLIGPDRFPLREDSPLRHEHEMLGKLINEVATSGSSWNLNLSDFLTGQELVALGPVAFGKMALAAAERHRYGVVADLSDLPESFAWNLGYAASNIVTAIMRFRFELDRAGLFDWLLYLSTCTPAERATLAKPMSEWIMQVEEEASKSILIEGEKYVLSVLRASLVTGPPLGTPTEPVSRLSRVIDDGADFYLVPGEAWSEAVNQDIVRLDPTRRSWWVALFKHALTATSARPSGRWLKEAAKLTESIGGDSVRDSLVCWLPLVTRGQTIRKYAAYPGDARSSADTMHEENANCLRGLLWMIQALPGREALTRAIASVALSAYKKVPGVGPRAVKIGNAAVYALSELGTKEAVGQLAMLKVRVRFGTAQKEIEKAFNAAAETLELPRDQIEELGVPTYGLEEGGLLREPLGDYRAEIAVTGSDAALRWFDGSGKPLKSVPARVKTDHKEELKELQQSLKDIQAMLPAQRDRIDGMFLLRKAWPIGDWRERYLDHPLVGTIAGRLIWCVDGVPALFLDGRPTDVLGQAIAHSESAEITPWHPVGRSIDEITAWRRRLEELEITQPFKQAHREVYLLTDAERTTGTYSNRFAAHVLRQHQFNALCAARGWKNKLRLMVDDEYPPASRELPGWGLRAEFWVEGIGDGYGTDTNDSGVYLRLATDQVRFYRVEAPRNTAHAGGGGYFLDRRAGGQRAAAEPLPLEEIPPLVLSEIMRDVDLFVGVASVGNDPNWQDGGPEGRHLDYWNHYSFGELSGTATTRKQVLERLVPRLKIADRCSFSDRFLVVRGDRRSYKIHLGSGNILMEPNDQYLCIVPDSRAREKSGNLFLPFEGDNLLSIIISKAFLLAEDTKITDSTITRQIDVH